MLPSCDRADVLAKRVRWLDQHRRHVAIAVAFLLAVTLTAFAKWIFGPDWPMFHARLVAVMAGVITWWIVEVALAWVTALWETEADRLRSDRGLPPMRIVKR
jgi:membrane protein YdbS with pleckstrin-like domain